MTSASAPGKLFIAGEYAVVEPGEPAILIAVDRFLTVEAVPARGDSGTITSSHYPTPIDYHLGPEGVTWREPRRDDLVSLTFEHMWMIAQDLGIRTAAQDISITSDLESPEGTKYGLGSSGAVTVAMIDVLNRAWGIGLSELERFRVGMLVTIQLSPNASGADLATQTLGGWVRYTSPDREQLRNSLVTDGFVKTLRATWAGCSLERIPAPTGISCYIGWTGSPAQTDALVAVRNRTSSAYRAFLVASKTAVEALTGSLREDDTLGILEAYKQSRDALLTFDGATGGGIETATLRTLRFHAERYGAVAKPSGAGGGDCGLVLSESHLDLSRMLNEWKQSGIECLPLTATTQEGKR